MLDFFFGVGSYLRRFYFVVEIINEKIMANKTSVTAMLNMTDAFLDVNQSVVSTGLFRIVQFRLTFF